MNAIKLVAVRSLLLGAVLGAAALLPQTAQAGGYDGRGYQDGRHGGYAAGWNGYQQGGQGRRYHREYGWYAPGQYYNDIDNRGGGRVWCPVRRTYVLPHQRYAQHGRHDRGRHNRDDRRWRRDDRNYSYQSDNHDDRNYGGYDDRDAQYRGW